MIKHVHTVILDLQNEPEFWDRVFESADITESCGPILTVTGASLVTCQSIHTTYCNQGLISQNSYLMKLLLRFQIHGLKHIFHELLNSITGNGMHYCKNFIFLNRIVKLKPQQYFFYLQWLIFSSYSGSEAL